MTDQRRVARDLLQAARLALTVTAELGLEAGRAGPILALHFLADIRRRGYRIVPSEEGRAQ